MNRLYRLYIETMAGYVAAPTKTRGGAARMRDLFAIALAERDIRAAAPPSSLIQFTCRLESLAPAPAETPTEVLTLVSIQSTSVEDNMRAVRVIRALTGTERKKLSGLGTDPGEIDRKIKLLPGVTAGIAIQTLDAVGVIAVCA